MNWEKLSVFIDDKLTTLTTLWSSQKIHNEIEAAKSVATADAANKFNTVQGSLDAHAGDKENPHVVTVTQIGAETPTGAQSKVDTHANATTAHTWGQIGGKPTTVATSGLADAETTAGAQVKADAAKTAAINTAASDATTKAKTVQENLNTHAANVTDAHDTANRLQTMRSSLTNYCDQSVANIDASKITSGVLDIARIPAAALERLTQVANQAARFALTTDSVQLGDTVKQLDTGIMYVVVDTANLNNVKGYVEYTAGTAAAVPWTGVQDKPTTVTGYGITDAYTKTEVDGKFTTTIGDYVFGKSIKENTDLNTLTTPGTYYCSYDNAAATLVNSPVKIAFSLEVIRIYSNTYTIQRLSTYNTNKIYQRYICAGTSGDWKEIATTDMITGYGLGSTCPKAPESDANKIVATGFYHIYGYDCGGLNIPTETGAATAFIMAEVFDANNIKQTLFDRGNGAIWIRQKMGGTWKDWVKQTTNDNTINNVRVLRDVARFYSNSASAAGTLKITIPASWNNTMMSLKISGFNYKFGSNSIWEATIGGYNCVSPSQWYCSSAILSPECPFTSVRFGHDGTNCCILLGVTSTAWSYPSIKIQEVQLSHAGTQLIPSVGWKMSLITDETGITVPSQTTLKTLATLENPVFSSGITLSGSIENRSASLFQINNYSGKDMEFVQRSGGGISFYTNNGDVKPLQLLPDGKVGIGIGTTSQTYKLQVNGGIASYGNTDLPATCSMAVLTGGYGTPNSGKLIIGDGTGWKYNISKRKDSVTTDLVTFLDTGNVGIGTDLPYSTLSVKSLSLLTSFTGNRQGSISIDGLDDSGKIAAFDFKGGINQPWASIGCKATGQGSYLHFGTSNSYVNGITNTAITIDYNGKVGMGTITPQYPLDVANSNWATTNLNRVKTLTTGETAGYLLLSGGNSTNSYANMVYAGISSIAESSVAGNETGALLFATKRAGGSLTERVRIKSNGNVGIGIDSPQSTLHTTGNTILGCTANLTDAMLGNNQIGIQADDQYIHLSWKDNSGNLRTIRFTAPAAGTGAIRVI